jgi:hypothetical protein
MVEIVLGAVGGMRGEVGREFVRGGDGGGLGMLGLICVALD